MRKELLGAVVIFGLGVGGAAWAQDTTAPANPAVVEPTTEAPAMSSDTSQSTTPTVAPSTDSGTAQSTTEAPAAATPADTEAVATTTQDGETVQEVANDHLLGTDLIGADVVQSDGTSIGEISDLVIEPETHVIKNVVIDVGGFLGIGTKTVTLPVDDLTGPNQDGDLQVGMSREQIETLPDFVGKPEPDQVPTMADPAAPMTTDSGTTNP
jgi:sporulation protein YlmC with PRC-barrel domain